jgi:mono/diheme cytochrome c family protein
MRTTLICVIVAAAALAAGAAANSRWDRVPPKVHARLNPVANKPEAAAAGAQVYRDHCLQCHKESAQGDGHKRPALRSQEIRSVSDGDLEWFLRQGDRGRGMPSWSSLPEIQRWQVVAYLRSIQ